MGMIYKLMSVHDPRVYVGQTTKSPKHRMRGHHCSYKQWLNDNHGYMTSFDLLKYTDCTMEVLEENVPDEMLVEREGYWYSQFDCINKYVPGRSREEYRRDTKDVKSEYDRQRYRDNIDGRLELNKQYYQANRDTISEQKKQYREANKDKLNQKFECECGGTYTHGHRARHKKSKSHQLFLSGLGDQVSIEIDSKTTGYVSLRVQVNPKE